MYERNPWEINVGSSEREVRVSEGSSYRESSVIANWFLCLMLQTVMKRFVKAHRLKIRSCLF